VWPAGDGAGKKGVGAALFRKAASHLHGLFDHENGSASLRCGNVRIDQTFFNYALAMEPFVLSLMLMTREGRP
jgi:hypothetical protein